MSDPTIAVDLTQQQDCRFLIEFGTPVLHIVGDEPVPLGGSAGPSPYSLGIHAVRLNAFTRSLSKQEGSAPADQGNALSEQYWARPLL